MAHLTNPDPAHLDHLLPPVILSLLYLFLSHFLSHSRARQWKEISVWVLPTRSRVAKVSELVGRWICSDNRWRWSTVLLGARCVRRRRPQWLDLSGGKVLKESSRGRRSVVNGPSRIFWWSAAWTVPNLCWGGRRLEWFSIMAAVRSWLHDGGSRSDEVGVDRWDAMRRRWRKTRRCVAVEKKMLQCPSL